MNQKNDFDADLLLEQVVTALRDQPVPEFVDPMAHGLSKARAEKSFDSCRQVDQLRKRRRSLGVVIGTAAMAFAAAVVVVLSSGPIGGQKVAFAQIQEAVSKTRSMRCRCLDFHGDDDPFVSTSVRVAGIGSRAEQSRGHESITNLKSRRSIYIDHSNRKAEISQLYLEGDGESSSNGFMEKIRNLPSNGAKEIGSTVFHGKKVLKFVFTMNGEFDVLVDPATKLPVRMEMSVEKGSPGGKRFREVWTDFVFDAPADESLFEIKIPPGYAVTYCEEPKDRKPVDTRAITVTPGKSFGPVVLGSSKEQVITSFGAPDQIVETHRGPRVFTSPGGDPLPGQKDEVDESLSYRSLGFGVEVTSDEGVTSATFYGRRQSGPMARDFLGTTDAQIALGASVDEVLKAYGKPDVRSHLRGEQLQYSFKGISFDFHDDKLSRFSIMKPLSAEIEIIDNGDGSWTQRIREKKTP